MGDVEGPYPWAPTGAEVAAVLWWLTRGPMDGDLEQSGAPRGQFDTTTNPDRARVESLIALACREVEARAGVPVPTGLEPLARVAALWGTVAMIVQTREWTPADDTGDVSVTARADAALEEFVMQARRAQAVSVS